MTRLITWLLQLYKRLISPFLPASCRFVPSCSEYAAEAVAKHGPLRGTGLAMWRLFRCNPFSRGGYDPVPAAKKAARPEHQAASARIISLENQE
jgi:putative membrane protein insertion efficiency factor